MSDQMFQTLFSLKMSTKQLEKLSKKAEKDAETEKLKVKKAIQQKNLEGARIYAENAIRKKNEYINFLRLASRIDAVKSRVQTAMAMKQVTKDLGLVTRSLDKAMESMDLNEMSAVMEKFERQFEALDVHAGMLDQTMMGATASLTPEDQIDSLIRQVADENSLAIAQELDTHTVGTTLPATGSSTYPRVVVIQATLQLQSFALLFGDL